MLRIPFFREGCFLSQIATICGDYTELRVPSGNSPAAVHQWVWGFTQQLVMPQLPITWISPTRLSAPALFHQSHLLRQIWTAPKPVRGRSFRHSRCPSSSFPIAEKPPRTLPACHASVLMRSVGSARQTPGVWQRHTCCASVFPPLLTCFLSAFFSLNTRAVDNWQFDSKLFSRVGGSCQDGVKPRKSVPRGVSDPFHLFTQSFMMSADEMSSY